MGYGGASPIAAGGRADDWRPAPVAYVVCDVDGTLIGPNAHATDEVVDAVRRAQSAGIRVGFATGRMRVAVSPLLRQLGALGPHIFCNGAEVRDGRGIVSTWTLTAAQVDGLLAVARERDDTYVEIYTDDAFHVSSWDERARPHWQVLGHEPASVLGRAADLDGVGVLKATFATFDDRAVEPVINKITAVGALPGPAGSPRTPGLHYVNATHPDAGKGGALIAAAAHLRLDLSAVAAVGDAANDLSMLAVAGTAIAMGQAPDDVRQAAHLVVPDVDGHGVAVALDALVAWRLQARAVGLGEAR